MLTKRLIAVAFVILFSVFGVGMLVGMQLGAETGAPLDGGVSDETPTDVSDGGAVETATTSQETQTATTTTAAPTTEVRTSIPPRRFNDANITRYVRQFINEERQANGAEPLRTTGTTAEGLSAMAKGHSDGMADAGRAIHEIDGVSSADRYRKNDLYETCSFESSTGAYVVSPDRPEKSQLEAIERVVAGQRYEDGGEQQFHETDRAVARAIVDNWMASNIYRDRLLLDNAARLGVGVTVTSTGNVYATANLCG